MNDAGAPVIEVHVNGEPRPGAAEQSLPEFLTSLGLGLTGILVERNGVALFRGEWEQTRLADGDRLEILRVVAGG